MTPRVRPASWAEPTRGYPPPVLSRWGVVWRYGLASVSYVIGLIVVIVEQAVPSEGVQARPTWMFALDLGLFPVGLILIRMRRRFPLGVALALSVMSSVSSSCFVLWAWSVISVATRRRWREVTLVGATTLIVGTAATMLLKVDTAVHVNLPDGSAEPAPEGGLLVGLSLATIAIVCAALVAWGFYIGARRDLVASLTERAETAEREQALRVEQAQSGERARIAREMHDVLAHRISLVSMHAGILAFREDLSAAETREIARIIQDNSSASLSELRSVLGTLREPGTTPPKPQPTLADLTELLDDARSAGVSITVSDAVTEASAVPPVTGRHAYRIVQEALTNARKHAVGAPVRLTLSGGPGEGLSIEVSNPLTSGAGLAGAGLGLVGMAERAQIAGGTCQAGTIRGSFVVKAWLPWE